jgi:AraC-like DNA-binding protein
MLNISRHHFCRQFKNLTGKSAIDYINIVRIEKAYVLLKQGTLNVTEAAISTGFNNISYFSRLFKYYKKMSPSQVSKGFEPISMI